MKQTLHHFLDRFFYSFSLTDLRSCQEKTGWKVWLLLAASIVYFAVLQLALRHDEPGLGRDSVRILECVTQWHRTGVYAAESTLGNFVPPFALYCFRLPLALALPLEQGILVLTLLLGMTVPLLFFLSIREAGGSARLALVSAVLMASNPYLHNIYKSILRDPVFIPLALLAIYLMLRNYRAPKLWLAGAAGLVSALAFLTRYEGIMLPALFAVSVIAAMRRDGMPRKSLRSAIVFLFFWAAGMCIPLGLWGVAPVAVKIYVWRFANLSV